MNITPDVRLNNEYDCIGWISISTTSLSGGKNEICIMSLLNYFTFDISVTNCLLCRHIRFLNHGDV